MPSPSTNPLSYAGHGLSDIVIADRLTDANQRRIRGTSNLNVSWQLSAAGMLTCDVTLRDLKKAGLSPSGLQSKWIHYEHPTAGHWGGIVTGVRPSDSIVGIEAESWAAAWRKKLTVKAGYSESYLASAVQLQVDALRAESGIGLAYLDGSNFGGGETLVGPEFHEGGQDMYEAFLPMVLQSWEDTNAWRVGLQAVGWNVDPLTRKFTFDATYGRDLSATVSLRDGRHSVSSEWSDDITDVINDVEITAKVNSTYTTSIPSQNQSGVTFTQTITQSVLNEATARADNVVSVARHGRQQLRMNHEAVFPSMAALQVAAANLVTGFSQNQQAVSIQCADVDLVWRNFREGDIVYAWLANNDAAGPMVIRHRALDLGRGVMTVSGEADLA
jgi:hypothetical protein